MSKTGQSIEKVLDLSKRKTDYLFNKIEKESDRLNGIAAREAKKLYNQVIASLNTMEGTSIPTSGTFNLSKISDLMTGLEMIQLGYRQAYGEFLRNLQQEILEISIEKEARIENILRKEGIEEDRTSLSDETFETMQMTLQKTIVKINTILEKWKSFVYDTFYSGISKGVPISVFRDLFFNENGTVKIGSSLNAETQGTAMAFVGEERTSWLRKKAEEQGYKYCWNANPLDPITKPECIQASIAGVIPESEMASVYGFPPRYICRCEVVYTRPEWVRINRDINNTIEQRRLTLIEELFRMPRQKSSWKRKGQTIYAKDIDRLKGNKMYADVKTKINLLVDSGEVSEFYPPGYVPGMGELPPVVPAET